MLLSFTSLKFFTRSGLLLLLCVVLHGAALGQTSPPTSRLNQLENAKIAYLTNKLALTQEQAQQFWPIYNEFSDKRRTLNHNLRQLRTNNPDGLSDQQLKTNLAQSLALRQQEVDLEKDYYTRFQRVITIRQVAQLSMAERQFTREVLQRVAGQHGGRRGPSVANGE